MRFEDRVRGGDGDTMRGVSGTADLRRAGMAREMGGSGERETVPATMRCGMVAKYIPGVDWRYWSARLRRKSSDEYNCQWSGA